eukprot:TRINITY_DN11672_c0_g1_i6.p1 TRINITY_DN11672_c0_g1~~TRINITY_DN11672_c0_g1_i6.p1  ORF type:complete len:269 (-),score=55.78 TRINITY_DN11672_c0_g1_i6:295-1101(-)
MMTAAGEVPFTVLYKMGDDLRQDQLVMQVIALMDKLLKRENVDLDLVTYSVLATGSNEGLVEFVEDSVTLHEIMKEHGSVIEFLRNHNSDVTSPSGIRQEVLDTYVKSTAGYCVITYLLGVGDRHLENLMLTSKGHLFHIDFGFILGRDPIARPQAARLTTEMIEPMGGLQGEKYAAFRSIACEAFNCLRRHASLIINLLLMMQDAGITNASTHTEDFSPEYLAQEIAPRFMLDKTNSQAADAFIQLIDQSLNAVIPKIHDFFHNIVH